eukprot:COSAG06_NODE_10684_length_1636_cov_792.893949_1_plen_39_part_10
MFGDVAPGGGATAIVAGSHKVRANPAQDSAAQHKAQHST